MLPNTKFPLTTKPPVPGPVADPLPGDVNIQPVGSPILAGGGPMTDPLPPMPTDAMPPSGSMWGQHQHQHPLMHLMHAALRGLGRQ